MGLPEYISFLLVSFCHTYDQTMHILQKFVPLNPVKKLQESKQVKPKLSGTPDKNVSQKGL